MNYLIKYKNNQKGSSLVELLIVIGIFAIFATISVSTYTNFKAHNNLEIAVNGLVQSLRYAQSNAQVVNGNSKWGIKIINDKVTVFKGLSYNVRDVSADQILDLTGGISSGGLSEIIFEKITGDTLTTGNITLTNNSGVRDISINEKGTITY